MTFQVFHDPYEPCVYIETLQFISLNHVYTKYYNWSGSISNFFILSSAYLYHWLGGRMLYLDLEIKNMAAPEVSFSQLPDVSLMKAQLPWLI